MTSKLTREENVQAVFDLKAGYTLGLADVEILKRVARMALAAMDSEPVVYASEETLAYAAQGELLVKVLSQPAGDAIIPLYRHAQQPVVDIEPAQMFGIGSIFKPQVVSEQEADCDDCAHYNPKICHGEGCPAISQQSAQPAPVVPDENVSFHRLPGESEYDRLNRQREWMESKSKLAKVTAAAPDDLTERLLRLRAQATLDGSYLDTEEWDSLACDVIKALNACRAAMLAAAPQEVKSES